MIKQTGSKSNPIASIMSIKGISKTMLMGSKEMRTESLMANQGMTNLWGLSRKRSGGK